MQEAVAMVLAGLGWIAGADSGAVPVAALADCLRGLERIASVGTAARAGVRSAFDAACGYEDDGAGSARSWLRWQCQVTGAAAAGSVGSMRRLRLHRAVAEALRRGNLGVLGAGDL